jgi:hypothetical protein
MGLEDHPWRFSPGDAEFRRPDYGAATISLRIDGRAAT